MTLLTVLLTNSSFFFRALPYLACFQRWCFSVLFYSKKIKKAKFTVQKRGSKILNPSKIKFFRKKITGGG